VRDVVSVSIPHTGTYFTIKLFTDAGFSDGSLFHQARGIGPHIYHGHMLKAAQIERAAELALEMPLIIPFRHPYRVEHSWNLRGRPLSEMFQCFRTLLERFAPLKPYFVPIDSQKRGEILENISESLGVRLKTDGSVVNGVRGTHKMRMDEFTPSKEVVELTESLQPLMAELY
jgi:hypothetical protein